MSNSRTILLVALAFVAVLLWQAWQQDYAPKPAMQAGATATAAPGPVANNPNPPPTPPSDVPQPTALPAADATAATPPPAAAPKAPEPSQHIDVRTDLLHVIIDTRGATIVQADLLNYPRDPKHREQPVRLLDDSDSRYFVAQSGLVSTTSPVPGYQAVFTAAATHYTLAPGSDRVEVPLTWTDASGISVRRTYVFTRGSYLIVSQQGIDNRSSKPWNGNAYRQLQRVPPVIAGGGFAFNNPERYAFAGAAWYSPQDKFQKLAFNKYTTDKLCQPGETAPQRLKQCAFDGGWAAMLQHYFFAAWIPPSKRADVYQYGKSVDRSGNTRYWIRSLSPVQTVQPGHNETLTAHLYIGPTLQSQLDAIEQAGIAKGLSLTADYGMLTPIAQPMHWILVELHHLVRNWGLAIILLVLLIKLALFKVSEAQYSSMAKMRKLQPRMQALKERYGDDKQKLSAATMELYKKEKINPLGGCLPTLIQIPVFFALYYVLLESVELRQAPFFGWIQNLSAPDPYYILPIINALIMIGAQWLSPASPGMDPTQAKMMKAMPLLFAVLFLFFPAGLVLYYAVNGGLSLLQQWIITRRLQVAEKRSR